MVPFRSQGKKTANLLAWRFDLFCIFLSVGWGEGGRMFANFNQNRLFVEWDSWKYSFYILSIVGELYPRNEDFT